jgi:hypothetical protein
LEINNYNQLKNPGSGFYLREATMQKIIIGSLALFVIIFGISTAEDKMAENKTPRNILGTKKVTQIGLIVKDVEKSSQAYADFLGMEKPEIIITDPLENSAGQTRFFSPGLYHH